MEKVVFGTACLVVLVGCGPSVFFQDDGFRKQKLGHPCGSIEKCEDLEIEAQRRVEGCKANTVGYVRCSDARADLQTVRAWKRRHVERKMEHDEKVETGERKKRYEESREAARVVRSERWRARAVETCGRQLNESACSRPPKYVSDNEREACLSECRATIEQALPAIFNDAVARCVQHVARSDGREAPVCSFRSRYGAGPHFDAAKREECSAKCAAEGKTALERQRALAPPPAPAEPSSGRASNASAGGPQAIRCCDGTLSPSCVCGGSRRGCCSHHGGVCGCAGD